MQTNPHSSTKTYIAIVVVLVLVAAGYYFYTSGKDTVKQTTSTGGTSGTLDTTGPGGTPAQSQVGAEVLSLLNRITSLKIDAKFFNDQSYNSLVDFSVPIPSSDVGRKNPFAPLPGSVQSNQSQQAAAAAQTLPRR